MNFEKYWLEAKNEKDLLELLKPFPANEMDNYPVLDFTNA